MEKEYSISYPTVRARIDEIVTELGECPPIASAAYEPVADECLSGEYPSDESQTGEFMASESTDEEATLVVDSAGSDIGSGAVSDIGSDAVSDIGSGAVSDTASSESACSKEGKKPPKSRRAILEMLSRGEIDAAHAQQMFMQ
jgi:hypothetical protein